MRAAAAVMIVSGLVGCRLDLDYGGASFVCTSGCPGDAGPGGDAADAAPDAAPLTYADVVLADAPILYLRFDETSGAVARDASGNGRDGLYLDGVSHDLVGAFAGSGAAARFDGVDDRVQVPDDEALRLNDDFSIELWARLDVVVNEFPGFVAKGGASADETGYIVYYPADNNILTLKRAGSDSIRCEDFLVPTDGYTHYVLTYDAETATVRWYGNGTLSREYTDRTWPTNIDSTPLTLGHADQFGQHWLDEVAFYDHELSAIRVATHYAVATAD